MHLLNFIHPQAIGEELELAKYDTWNVIAPEGTFLTRIGNDNFYEVWGPGAGGPWPAWVGRLVGRLCRGGRGRLVSNTRPA